MLLSSTNIREDVMPAIDLIIALQHGREPSMYTDIWFDVSEIKKPVKLVRETAAGVCIKLAQTCLGHTRKYIAEHNPPVASRAEDEFFAMKSKQVASLVNTADFWWYYIAEYENGNDNVSEAVSRYRVKYLNKGRLFRVMKSETSTT